MFLYSGLWTVGREGGLGMFIDRMGSFKPDYKTMSSKASLYMEAVHQTEDAMSSHCWYIPRSLAHIVTPSHTRRPDAPHLQASTHMQGNASKRPGAGGVEQWGGRGLWTLHARRGCRCCAQGEISQSRKKRGKENRFKKKPEKPEEEAQKRAKITEIKSERLRRKVEARAVSLMFLKIK
ncbi:hypothetical protein BJV77DRAFT_966089 [Russula vinacea]|nr:hypothetical protein BJV77DRAFT_966089 [Russula vinacea]